MRTYTTERYVETAHWISGLFAEPSKPDPVRWERELRQAWRVLCTEELLCKKEAKRLKCLAPFETYKLYPAYKQALRENGPRREAFAANRTQNGNGTKAAET